MADYNSSGLILPQIKDASVDNSGWFQSRAVGGKKKTYKRRGGKSSKKQSRKDRKSRKNRKTSMKKV